MCLRNFYEDGRVKMIKLKIPEIRFRRRCRMKREIRTLQSELNTYLNNKDGASKTKSLLDLLRQSDTVLGIIDSKMIEKRMEYRLMRQGYGL
jgi:hypothetical protein